MHNCISQERDQLEIKLWEPRACVIFKVGLGEISLLESAGGGLSSAALGHLEVGKKRGRQRSPNREARAGIKHGLYSVWSLGSRDRKAFQGGRCQLCQILLSSQDEDREVPTGFDDMELAGSLDASSSGKAGGRRMVRN